MDSVQGERTVDTHIECPTCVTEGIVTASGYATRLMWMPDLDPPFRCLAAHGGITEKALESAGVDPRLLKHWTGRTQVGSGDGQDAGASSDGDSSWVEAPHTQDPSVDRSVDAVIRRTRGL